ncbi:MAG: acyl-CoA synthetase [Acidobacteria bacterium]|nr:acyl-CoA synthetase [Acidobacteriota bacterium]
MAILRSSSSPGNRWFTLPRIVLPLVTTSTTNSGWNFADMWELHARRFPDAPAAIHGGEVRTWREFDQRANGIANTLLVAGAQRQDKVAQYMHNCPEYMESMFGLFKASLVPVNTNYRYTEDELTYLWDNSDSVAVIFHATYTERCAAVRSRVPNVKTWIWVDDGTHPCPDWAVSYESAANSNTSQPAPAWQRSGDDLYFLYTGGTTGMPKGVMWRQDDMVGSLDAPSKVPLPAHKDMSALEARVSKPGPVNMPAAPLMHGTGAMNAMWALALGGAVATMTSRTFDAKELLEVVQSARVNSIAIVGDAFAKPILRALDEHPGKYDISSLKFITSSGVMWSAETKAGMLRHHPKMLLIDSLGSSEAIGMASSTTSADGSSSTATFKLGPNTRVITEEGRDVVPGSGERGRIAMRGRTPIGYYKDEAKSASTFVVIDGLRYSIPGDFAEVDADGTVRLLGRGSQCINTGGEKVYPEEVEEVLKTHPSVLDAACVGVPDERFGEAITALVEPRPGATVDSATLVAHVRSTLAAYKSPKNVITVATIGRAPNGKLDYKRLKQEALEALGLTK